MVQKRSYRKIIKQNKKGGFSGVYVVIGKLKFFWLWVAPSAVVQIEKNNVARSKQGILSRKEKKTISRSKQGLLSRSKIKLLPGQNRVSCPMRKISLSWNIPSEQFVGCACALRSWSVIAITDCALHIQ